MLKALIGLTVIAASLSAFDATIPVVDMRDYYSEDRREMFIEQVGHALREVGFFAVCHSGIDQDLLDAAYSATTEFYHLPLEEKMQAHDAQNNGQRGFVPGESAKGQSVMDFKEYFHMGRQWPDDTLKAHGYPKNIWPENASYKASMLNLSFLKERDSCFIAP
ncbi:MAG: 2-oxoglutarate and iron-dependent oxygenase domain-containing protein [Chlamydiales bacterium]|nr:2-oxoglutarate and iron-dependent oxygenase domain-containing protein [Chlamydiales bacterium]